jgi:hypothetical protein
VTEIGVPWYLWEPLWRMSFTKSGICWYNPAMPWPISLLILAVYRTVFEPCGLLQWNDVWFFRCCSVSALKPKSGRFSEIKKTLSQNVHHIPLYNILQIATLLRRSNLWLSLGTCMCSNSCEKGYKKVALNFHLSCQYHSAQQRTAEQQHRHLCICTVLCCVCCEDH